MIIKKIIVKFNGYKFKRIPRYLDSGDLYKDLCQVVGCKFWERRNNLKDKEVSLICSMCYSVARIHVRRCRNSKYTYKFDNDNVIKKDSDI